MTVGYKILPEMDQPPDLLRYAALAEELAREEKLIRVYGESVIPILKEGCGRFKAGCSGR